MPSLPSVGAAAPTLAGPTDEGRFDLGEHRGHPVVVYFYPKDLTPGCTTEAQDFRDRIPHFEAEGAVVVGVSKDSAARHAKFRQKESLPFALLSDADGVVCEDWGVWAEKKLYGKVFDGIVRSTFLIDGDGKVARSWSPVKVKGHVDEVLGALRALPR